MHNKSINSTASHWPKTSLQILESAANIIAEKLNHQDVYTNPQSTKDFLTYKLGGYEREVFGVMMLNSQHQLIEFRELFFGTIDAASVYPREVVKAVLEVNAAAVIFSHMHRCIIDLFNQPGCSSLKVSSDIFLESWFSLFF
jgi:DNA repair protein RadC